MAAGGDFGYDDDHLDYYIEHDNDDDYGDETTPFIPNGASTPAFGQYQAHAQEEMEMKRIKKKGFILMAEPIRVTFHSSTMLDLVTNCPERFSASGTLSPPSNCDHSVIFASMNLFTHSSRSYKRHV